MPSERRRENGASTEGKRGFLARLARDSRGNTLAIVGAALVPLAGIIGSGVDMSRAYMAKTRLQSACDAAALAGRRIMQNDTFNSTVSNEAIRFFDFNFPEGLYQTAAFDPVVTHPDTGVIRVAASTTIPTAVMHLFGFDDLPLDVTCDASLDFVNTDVMLVLDVTGSMDWDVEGNWTWDDDERRITALRAAVLALYDELDPVQTQLEANGLELRYGFVPYSSTVNVGQLIRDEEVADGVDYLADSAPYQTRRGEYDRFETRTLSSNQITQTYSSSITQTECNKYAVNANYPTLNGQPAATGGPPPAPVTNVVYSLRDWGATGDTSGTSRTCRRYRTTSTTQTGWFSNSWDYRQVTLDTSEYKAFQPVLIATDDNGATASSGDFNMLQAATLAAGVSTTTVTWNGCIEERGTVATIGPDESNLTIPGGASDLNINLIPNNDATRWRPMWPSVVYRRNTNGTRTHMAGAACPQPAVRLDTWDREDMEDYVDALDPGGSTYHDVGMIWGARMISPGGIFADSPAERFGMPVSRHIIFMTDGDMDTDRNNYAFHGVELNDQRVSGGTFTSGDTDLDGRHMSRFRMACNAARSAAVGAQIWVIAFGTELTDEMLECASSENHASTIESGEALIERFRQIGNNIGALRLVQ